MSIPQQVFDLVVDRMEHLEKEIDSLGVELMWTQSQIDELSTQYKELADFINGKDKEANNPIVCIESVPQEEHKPMTLDEMQREAQKRGMSYGELVVYLKTGGAL